MPTDLVLDVPTLRKLDAQGLLEGELRRNAVDIVAARVRAITSDIQYKVERRGELIELLDDLRYGHQGQLLKPIRLAKRGAA